jgi:predicted ATP-grasp superfamily ATP-dependent carboligase
MKLLESLDYWGVAEIEYLIDARDNSPKLMEINPRFWGSMQGAIAAGVDFPVLLYHLVKFGEIPVSLDYKVGVRCRNVFMRDMYHLFATLKGKNSLEDKCKSMVNFLKFYEDDAYYYFSLDDVTPFLAFIYWKTIEKLKKVMKIP